MSDNPQSAPEPPEGVVVVESTSGIRVGGSASAVVKIVALVIFGLVAVTALKGLPGSPPEDGTSSGASSPRAEFGLTATQSRHLERLAQVCVRGACDVAAPAAGLVACLDTSGSVPDHFVERGLEAVARQVADSVRGPTRGLQIYIRRLDFGSYWPGNGVLAEEIPAVPVPPKKPDLSLNQYDAAQNRLLMRNYADEAGAWLELLRQAQQQAKRVANAIRHADLKYNQRGTDVDGCVLRAQKLLAPTSTRALWLVTDLQPYGPQSRGALRLNGVHVRVFYWCDDAAEVCEARQAGFSARLRRASAPPPVEFVDPQDVRF